MKYTLIYSHWRGDVKHRNPSVHFDRVETDDLKALTNTNKYANCVWLIFEGWPKLEGEGDSAPQETGQPQALKIPIDLTIPERGNDPYKVSAEFFD